MVEDLLAVGHQVEELDDVEFAVVVDDPDNRDAVLDRGHQFETGHLVAAVAAADDHPPAGRGHLGPDGGVGVRGHGSEAAGVLEGLAAVKLHVGRHPDHMRAGVSQHESVVRQELSQLLRKLSGMHLDTVVVDGLETVAVDHRTGLFGNADAGGKGIGQLPHGRPGVGDHRKIGLENLADLMGIEIDVHQHLVVKDVFLEAPALPLGKGTAHRQHHFGVFQRLACPHVAAGAAHADGKRVIVGDDPLGVHGRNERQLEPFHELQQFRSRAAMDTAVAEVGDDTLLGTDRLVKIFGKDADIFFLRQHRFHIDLDVPVIFGLRGRHIIGEIDMDRAGAPLVGQVDGFFEQVAGLLRPFDQEGLLGGSAKHGLGIGGTVLAGDLSQVAHAPPLPGRVGGDGHDRKGAGVGHAQAGKEVVGTGAALGVADPQLPGGHGIAVGHERSGLFVAGHDGPDLF